MATDIKILRETQRLCLCQRPMNDQTVRCATCNNLFHADCVDLQCDINGIWDGSCHRAIDNPTITDINERYLKEDQSFNEFQSVTQYSLQLTLQKACSILL
jgi:hypothetical protein